MITDDTARFAGVRAQLPGLDMVRKMDFLGLRTLTVIRDAEAAIQKKDPSFSIQKLD